MNRTLLPYLPIFIFLLFALGLATAMVVFSTLLGRRHEKQPLTDLSAYECGLRPADPQTRRLTV